jgi:predicted dehydrogenase
MGNDPCSHCTRIQSGKKGEEGPMKTSRREFLEISVVGAAGLMTGCVTTQARRAISPNGKLNHACVGVSGMGGVDLDNFRSNSRLEVVAICDVDSNLLSQASAKVPNARKYTDWREMLAKEGDRIDSINASVPDHMHAAITLAALHAGKHVYCQKPLAHDVVECRAMARAAKRAGAVTQLGTQAASGIGDRMAVQFLRDGVIGKVRRAVLFSNRPGAESYRLLGPRPAEGQKPPENLAWDLWIGTAPERAFAPGIYHQGLWRSWQDFGTGWSGDIGCHIFDSVWKGLGLTAPKTVTAEVQESWQNSKERRADTWPQSDHITWIFPGTPACEGSELCVEWFDGGRLPEAEVVALMKSGGVDAAAYEGSVVIGTEGTLLLPNTSGPILVPREKFLNIKRPNFKCPTHYQRFVDACLGGEPTNSPFEKVGPMAEAIILGTVAIRVPGATLQWDPRRLRIPNSSEADKLLRRTYRSGWAVDLRDA